MLSSGDSIDAVMAEYITIMIINNKSKGNSTQPSGKIPASDSFADNITKELEDGESHLMFCVFIANNLALIVIGSDYGLYP
jgi:hypothetical protein